MRAHSKQWCAHNAAHDFIVQMNPRARTTIATRGHELTPTSLPLVSTSVRVMAVTLQKVQSQRHGRQRGGRTKDCSQGAGKEGGTSQGSQEGNQAHSQEGNQAHGEEGRTAQGSQEDDQAHGQEGHQAHGEEGHQAHGEEGGQAARQAHREEGHQEGR